MTIKQLKHKKGVLNYWGTMPMAVFTFLEKFNFAGKTVIPFNTHGGRCTRRFPFTVEMWKIQNQEWVAGLRKLDIRKIIDK